MSRKIVACDHNTREYIFDDGSRMNWDRDLQYHLSHICRLLGKDYNYGTTIIPPLTDYGTCAIVNEPETEPKFWDQYGGKRCDCSGRIILIEKALPDESFDWWFAICSNCGERQNVKIDK